METLKLKIFDVLTEKIAVEEFEKWLYNTEEFLCNVNTNSFYFDIISINYKSVEWALKLTCISKSFLNVDYLEILKIKKSCITITESITFEETHNVLKSLIQNFDYDTNYSVLWKFYTLKDYFDLVEDSGYKTGTLLLEAKFYAEQTLRLIKKNENHDDLILALEIELTPFKKPKSSLIEILSKQMAWLIKNCSYK